MSDRGALESLTNFAVSGSQPDPEVKVQKLFDPQSVYTGVYIAIHGHFYQPPRENPYLDAIERQPGAEPFHNWNERIYYECYRPNAFARILNDQAEVIGIINNFEYLSFNIGPTLMSWLERHDTEVYQRILEADRKSCQRLNSHGNAIAQVYNHMILPLANERDKYTQIRWGKADFRHRFGREPEGMWLAETAIDYPTVAALIHEGIQFTVLAPTQAQRCRPCPTDTDPDPVWIEVGEGQIDPTQAYRCYLRDPEGNRDLSRYLDIFFYDGPISGDIGFDDLLNHSGHLIGRLAQAVKPDQHPAQLISVATDGETFGHHKQGTEKCLAYAFAEEFSRRGWTVTNFAHYLSLHPPTWEVELKPVTAWSCSHGVDRWQDDCGCAGGGSWHQQWRKPLRNTLNWLRDQLAQIYAEVGAELFIDPWAARDGYIQVIGDRDLANVNAFLRAHQTHELSEIERVDALRLLEMQRHSLLMFTSCGWFFEELSRPEGTQILRYANRAIELAAEVTGVNLEPEFLQQLALAPSNVELFKTGDQVYRQLVLSSQITPEQFATQYGINSLFTAHPQEQRLYCYDVQQLDYQMRQVGTLALAVGQIVLTSEITREQNHLMFGVLHLGGWDFHCGVQNFKGRRGYGEAKQKLFEALPQASAAHMIKVMIETLGDCCFGLQDIFVEERQRLMGLLSQETLTRLNQLYTQVYRDNYRMLIAFHREGLSVPQELQLAAEVTLSHRCLEVLRALDLESHEASLSPNHLMDLEILVTEAQDLHCRIQHWEIRDTLKRLLSRSLAKVLMDGEPETLAIDVENLERLIQVGQGLGLNLSLEQAQEIYFHHLTSQILPLYLGLLQRQSTLPEEPSEELPLQPAEFQPESAQIHKTASGSPWELSHLSHLLHLGQTLKINVQGLMKPLLD
ncbi:MAG: DUF3536 domain-containing protein [Oscillatoriales cyanobacterium RM2_1_1]|nr:DUF3536 domain-containing protein [Oscillatoriales cyanobacterium RM2_1_1]